VVPRRRYPVAMFAVAVAIGAAQIALSVEPAGQPPLTVAGLPLGAAIQPTPGGFRAQLITVAGSGTVSF